MSRTIIVCFDGTGSGRSLLSDFFKPIGECFCARKTRRMVEVIDVFMSEYVHSNVLDIVWERELPSIEQMCNDIWDSFKRERFSREFLFDHHFEIDRVALRRLPADKVALPCLSVDIRAYRMFANSEIFTVSACHKNGDSVPAWKDAAENPSNELFQLSLFLTVGLWRDKRHRRRCGADFWTVP